MQDRPEDAERARFLAEMAAMDSDVDHAFWRPEDLAAVLRHQLDAPLAFDLASHQSGGMEHVEDLRCVEGQPIRTFRELFHHPRPPVELLELTKEFAKSLAHRDDAPLPEQIATILYVLSIIVARARCGCRISQTDDEEQRRQVEWILSHPWVDESTRCLLREMQRTIAGSGVSQDSLRRETQPAESPGERSTPRISTAVAPLGQLAEYVLLQKLGEGGMGTVYKALHTEMDRFVAIKVIRQDRLEGGWALSRFRREIKAVSRLDHPHIVRAYDARAVDETHFLVMEYVDGSNLNELAHRCAPVSVADACELVRQAALGLQCAHEHGLVHRDIKPSNLMLTRQGQVKVLDLGLARIRTAGHLGETTALGEVMGTPDYMAPEQTFDSHSVDIRADIYSLGCTLYGLLAGVPPFGGSLYPNALAKLDAHRTQPPPPMRSFRRDVPDGLLAVLDRMLAKEPQQRFATPTEVAVALERFARRSDLIRLAARAEGRSTEARDGQSREWGLRRLVRRVRPGMILIGLALLLLLGVLIGLQRNRGRGLGEDSAPTVGESKNMAVPKPRALPGWIVLSWTRPFQGKPSLWLFQPDGKRRVNITQDPRYFDIHPRFSSDGRQIVFIRGESLTAPCSVCVCNSDGSELRPLAAPHDKSERFASPVWISPSRICYLRDPKLDREPDMEVWQADLDGSPPRMIFRLHDAIGKGNGVITDASPDGKWLAFIAQTVGLSATADVYVTDIAGKTLQTVWVDTPGEWKDARALWSPDGTQIAWHHNFTRGGLATQIYHGVGIARRDASGKWTPRLPSATETLVTPLAWHPHGDALLCARMHESRQRMGGATLFLMDSQFRDIQTLFDLEASPWQPGHRDLGRIADWAILPADLVAKLPH